MEKKVKKVLIYIIFIFAIVGINTSNVWAYTKEDILNIFNKVDTCSSETQSMLNGVKSSYTRLLNERKISDTDLNKIYANMNEVIKTLEKNNLCSVDQEAKMSEAVRNELYNLYIRTNDIILAAPKLSGEEVTDSKIVIDTTDKQLEIYENGVLSDVIEFEEKLNYVGLNKLVIIGIVLMSIVLVITIIFKVLKKEKFITTAIIYIIVLLLPSTILLRNEVSVVLDTISLMSVNGSGTQKQIVTENEKIISYPSYGDKYAEIIINGERGDIYFGDSASILKKGIGQSSSSYLPGENNKTVLSGHNTGIFGKLMDVKTGEEITIETVYGDFIYKIENIEVVNDNNTGILSKDYDLIMYTCYPRGNLYGNKRIVVYSNLIGSKWIGGNNEE